MAAGHCDITHVSENGKDLCVMCYKETPYDNDTPIIIRKNYIEGVGQLCKECDEDLLK